MQLFLVTLIFGAVGSFTSNINIMSKGSWNVQDTLESYSMDDTSEWIVKDLTADTVDGWHLVDTIGVGDNACFVCNSRTYGLYGPYWIRVLNIKPIDISGFTSPRMSFWHVLSLSDGDSVGVYGSSDGINWINLATYTDTISLWRNDTLDLSAFAGSDSLRIRFVFFSNGGYPNFGWAIDNIAIFDYGVLADSTIYSNDFESDSGNMTPGTGDVWQWGTIVSGPNSAHSGSKAWATDTAGPMPPDSQVLYSDWINIPIGAQSCSLSFWYWNSLPTMMFYASFAVVEYTIESLGIWTFLDTLKRETNGWESFNRNIPTIVPGSRIRFRWIVYYDGSQGIPYPSPPGLYLDDLSLKVTLPKTAFYDDLTHGDGNFTYGTGVKWHQVDVGGAHGNAFYSGQNSYPPFVCTSLMTKDVINLTDLSYNEGYLYISLAFWLKGGTADDDKLRIFWVDETTGYRLLLDEFTIPSGTDWYPYGIQASIPPFEQATNVRGRIEFRFESNDNSTTDEGVYIDDFMVIGGRIAPPYVQSLTPADTVAIGFQGQFSNFIMMPSFLLPIVLSNFDLDFKGGSPKYNMLADSLFKMAYDVKWLYGPVGNTPESTWTNGDVLFDSLLVLGIRTDTIPVSFDAVMQLHLLSIDTLMANDFESANALNGWNIFDGNADGHVWQLGDVAQWGANVKPPLYGTQYAYITCTRPITIPGIERLTTPAIPLPTPSHSPVDYTELVVFSVGVGFARVDSNMAAILARQHAIGGQWTPWRIIGYIYDVDTSFQFVWGFINEGYDSLQISFLYAQFNPLPGRLSGMSIDNLIVAHMLFEGGTGFFVEGNPSSNTTGTYDLSFVNGYNTTVFDTLIGFPLKTGYVLSDLDGNNLGGGGSNGYDVDTASKFVVEANRLAALELNDIPDTVTAGQAVSCTLRVLNQFGQIWDYDGWADLYLLSGNPILSATKSDTIDSVYVEDGVWTGQVKFLKTVDSDRMVAQIEGVADTTNEFTVKPSVLGSVEISDVPDTVDTATTVACTVRVYDEFGNFKDDYNGWADLYLISGNPILLITKSDTIDSVYIDDGDWIGQIQFSEPVDSDRMVVEVDGFADTTNKFTVLELTPSEIRISDMPDSVRAGEAVSCTVAVYDQNGALMTNYDGWADLYLLSGNPILSATKSDTIDSVYVEDGVWTGQIKFLKTVDSDRMVAQIGDVADTTNEFKVLPGAEVGALSINDMPTPIVAGTPVQCTVTVFDRYGNFKDDFDDWIDIGLLSGNPLLSGTKADTIDSIYATSGQWSGSVRMIKAVSYEAIVVDYHGISDTTNPFTVKHAELDTFVFSEIKWRQIVNQPFKIEVLAQDEYGNLVDDFSEKVTLDDGTGTLRAYTKGEDFKFVNGKLTATVVIDSPMFNDSIVAIWNGKNNRKLRIKASMDGGMKRTVIGVSNKFSVAPQVIDYVQILRPEADSVELGQYSEMTFVVYEERLTPLPGGDRRIITMIGVGPDGSDPSGADWKWFEAKYVKDTVIIREIQGHVQRMIADMYEGRIPADSLGEFDVACKARLTFGDQRWVYGDLNGSALGFGDSNRYSPDQAMRLIVMDNTIDYLILATSDTFVVLSGMKTPSIYCNVTERNYTNSFYENPHIEVQVGYGSNDTPSTWPDTNWFRANFFANFGAADVYEGQIPVDADSGTYFYTVRARFVMPDKGYQGPWLYGDLDGEPDASSGYEGFGVLIVHGHPPDTSGPDWARLVYPNTLVLPTNTTTRLIFGRVYKENGDTSFMDAQVGYGSDVANPEIWTHWSDAAFHRYVSMRYHDSTVTAFEYQGSFVTPENSGVYYYGYRFRYSGSRWVYADLDGTDNGFTRPGRLYVYSWGVLAMPSDLEAEVGAGGVTLRWTEPELAKNSEHSGEHIEQITSPNDLAFDCYRIFAADEIDGPYELIGETVEPFFVDRNTSGSVRFYYIMALYNDGTVASPIATPMAVDLTKPTKLEVASLAPNPAKEWTSLRFALPEESDVIIQIYDITGRLLWAEKKHMNAGIYTWNWDMKDRRGVKLGAGVYFIKLKIGDKVFTKRLVVMR